MISRLALVAALLVPFAIACSSSDDGAKPGDDQYFTGRVGELDGMCGGFAGITCKEGLRCKLSASHPDASGRCIVADDGPPATCLAIPTCDGADAESQTACNPAEGADCYSRSMCGRTVQCRKSVEIEGTLTRSVGIGGENTGSSIKTASGVTELVLGDHARAFVDGRFAKVTGPKKLLAGVESGARTAIEVQKLLVCPASNAVFNCMPPVSPDNAACGEDRGWIQAKCEGVSYLD
jgi:hypothetical protein